MLSGMAPTIATGELVADLDRLRERADALAASLGTAAAASRTLGRERAVLRLLGITGIDREGRPLAAEVVDRYVSGRRDRLASGVALPFAIALLEYDAGPQQMALDIAGGAVDLALEAQLLADPPRRAAATVHLERLVAAAVDRIDANRTARRDLIAVLGDRGAPWIGTTLIEPSALGAASEAAELVRAGADVVRVEVPVGRELAARLGEIGQPIAAWRPGDDHEADPAPSGSQRGLTRLRDALDRAAAERGAYVRLATAPAPLAGPEGAIVAAFERVDLLELDPMAEIVATGVDADRALSDFAFAARVVRRGGTSILLGAGPLVVAPDLDAGVNSDPATRAGRGLALQALGVALAIRHGLDASAVLVGALPAWIGDEPDSAARAAGEVALRRHLFAGHDLAFLEPASPGSASRWSAISSAVLPGSGTGLILRRPAPAAGFGPIADSARAAAEVAAALGGSLEDRAIAGVALEHAMAAVATAIGTLERLDGEGWASVVGRSVDGSQGGRLGGDAVVPAATVSDPVEVAFG